jgi:hypothetical protein
LFDRLLNSTNSAWELSFDNYSLQPTYGDNTEVISRRQKAWQEAFDLIAGEESVLSGKGTANQLERKGYKPVVAPENLISAAGMYGVRTSSSVLSADELSGREITGATPDAQAAVDYVWSRIENIGLTNGKEKPLVRSFHSILDAGTMLNGYYRDEVVYIHRDLGNVGSVVGGNDALSDRLLKVALEEVAHYATNGATDNSRDFQDYVLEVAVKLARRSEEKVSVRRGRQSVSVA